MAEPGPTAGNGRRRGRATRGCGARQLGKRAGRGSQGLPEERCSSLGGKLSRDLDWNVMKILANVYVIQSRAGSVAPCAPSGCFQGREALAAS